MLRANHPLEIRAVLNDSQWRVRPPGSEIPAGLRNSLAGDVFSRFARMSDGEDHQRRRQIATDLIASLDLGAIPSISRDVVRRLHPATPRDLQFLVPGMVLAALLALPTACQQTVVGQVRALVIGARPTATESEHNIAIKAIEAAVPFFVGTLELSKLDDLEAIAARISLIFQASDACAAMIGNALILLAGLPNPATAAADRIVRESMRAKVPVRSTTRFRADETVVLDLEAAHHQQPEAGWTFGIGAHTCPGSSMATAIASACIDAVIEQKPFDLVALEYTGWEELPNVWIPILTLQEGDSK